jgi:hypothetical protein
MMYPPKPPGQYKPGPPMYGQPMGRPPMGYGMQPPMQYQPGPMPPQSPYGNALGMGMQQPRQMNALAMYGRR